MKSLLKAVNCFENEEGAPAMHGKTPHGRRFAFLTMVLLGGLLAGPGSLWALTLGEAKARGLVGETPAGYLGMVSGKGSSGVRALMHDVNQKRKQKYQGIAKRNGTSLRAVETLAGKTAIKKTRSGHYIQLPSGKWTTK